MGDDDGGDDAVQVEDALIFLRWTVSYFSLERLRVELESYVVMREVVMYERKVRVYKWELSVVDYFFMRRAGWVISGVLILLLAFIVMYIVEFLMSTK